MVPGITPQIIQASVGALLKSFSVGFRYVWVSAGCFTVVAAIGKFLPSFFFLLPLPVALTIPLFPCAAVQGRGIERGAWFGFPPTARRRDCLTRHYERILWLTNRFSSVAAIFLIDPKKEFNMHIDAPAEKEEDLYASK